MKKTLYETMLTLIEGNESAEATEVRDAITAELAKGKAKAEANRAVYADIHDKVIAVLSMSTNPVTAQEIADETGIARGKIVYGLTNYWGDEVVADKSGKTTTYRLA
jgi:response regulator of citrate/malate metabolism